VIYITGAKLLETTDTIGCAGTAMRRGTIIEMFFLNNG
jgi:hypothetical protein